MRKINKGIKLQDLKIQSFVTAFSPWESKTIKGGDNCWMSCILSNDPPETSGGYSMPIDTSGDPAAVMEPPKHQPSGPC